MWESVPKSYILMTSQNARVWGLHPQCDHIECQACFTPEHPMHYQKGHPPGTLLGMPRWLRFHPQ